MIFLGDLACPPEKVDSLNAAIRKLDILDNEIVVLNFEATIAYPDDTIEGERLHNDPRALDALLEKAEKVIVSCANNHMYDYPDRVRPTAKFLESKGVGVFGLKNSDGTIKPYEYKAKDGRKYAFFGHCWSLYTSTNPNNVNDTRIVDDGYGEFLSQVSSYIIRHPEYETICFMHWNYDLEAYPFPMHISLAHDLIENGVSAVIGSHSHLPQGVEIYKNRPIAYGLGNFYLPSGIYFNGNLSYPRQSHTTFGIKTGTENEVLVFETDCENTLSYKFSTDLSNRAIRDAIPEWQGYFDSLGDDYRSFFKMNRHKRILVPIFDKYAGKDYEKKMWLAIGRIKLIKQILKFLRR